MANKELRPYQQECHERIISDHQNGITRLMAVLFTGAGKTFTAIKLIERMGFKRVLWLSFQEELVNQSGVAFIRNKFDSHFADEIQKEGFVDYIKAHGVIQSDNFSIGCIKADVWEPDANVVMGSVMTMVRRLSMFEPDYFDCIVADEAHLFASLSASTVLNHFKPNMLLGMSVGPESFVEVIGPRGFIFFGKIEDLWILLPQKSMFDFGYEYKILSGFYSRGWEVDGFYWKPIKKIIRHACDKPCKKIKVGGDWLTVTNDHSVFTIKDESLDFVEKKSEELIVGDICIYDFGHNAVFEKEISVIDLILKISPKTKIHVAVDLSSVDHETFKEYGINYKTKYQYKNGRHGHFLPLKQYIKMRHILPEPKLIYHEGARGGWIKPKFKLSEFAYLIGFYYGDGWFSGSRLCFAVENKRHESFLKKISEIKSCSISVKYKKTHGASKEITLTNSILISILKYHLGNKRCWDKQINPIFITQFSKNSRLKLINGLIDSDGNIQFRTRNREMARYVTTSKPLANSVSAILRSVGVMSGISKRKFSSIGGTINGRTIITKRHSYSVNWSMIALRGDKSARGGNRKKYNHGSKKFIEAPIKEIKEAEPPKYVYDIEMTGHPSFVANGVLVHNTATPFRADGLPLADLFDKISFEYGLDKGIADGYACELDAIKITTNVSLDKVKTTGGDFNQKDLTNEINTLARNQLIVDSYRKYALGRQCIAFCVDIQHAIDLSEAFKLNGFNCEAVSSDEERTPDRSEKISKFKEGKIDILTNVNILSIGFDHPDTNCAIMARPTKSLTLYLQSVGRVARLKSSKIVSKFGQNAIILDVVDNTSKHNLINAWELDRQKPVEERVFVSREKKDKLLAERQKRLLEHTRDKDERVSLLKIPKLTVKYSGKWKEAATDKQLEWVYSLGYPRDAHYTKEQCNQIILSLPATEKQIGLVKFLGYRVDDKKVLTRADIESAIQDAKKKNNPKAKNL